MDEQQERALTGKTLASVSMMLEEVKALCLQIEMYGIENRMNASTIQSLLGKVRDMEARNAHLTAENARLRSALETLADKWRYRVGSTVLPWDFAQAALDGDSEAKP